MVVERPLADEYNPYYANYVKLVPDGDLFALLAQQADTVSQTLTGLPDAKADYRFGPNEWSVKEMIGHINDTERIFAYRALRVVRNDQTPLHGFDQDPYVAESNFSARTLPDLVEEFVLQRRANVLTFKNMPPDFYMRRGTASGNPFTVRAILYTMIGHVNHHLESLRSNYGL